MSCIHILVKYLLKKNKARKILARCWEPDLYYLEIQKKDSAWEVWKKGEGIFMLTLDLMIEQTLNEQVWHTGKAPEVALWVQMYSIFVCS